MRVIFEDPHDGTELVRVVRGSTPPRTVQVRFEPPSSSETLRGEPTRWCNSPSAGQPLVFNVPAPQNPGDPDVTGTLRVTQATAGATVNIPVRIKHGG